MQGSASGIDAANEHELSYSLLVKVFMGIGSCLFTFLTFICYLEFKVTAVLFIILFLNVLFFYTYFDVFNKYIVSDMGVYSN